LGLYFPNREKHISSLYKKTNKRKKKKDKSLSMMTIKDRETFVQKKNKINAIQMQAQHLLFVPVPGVDQN